MKRVLQHSKTGLFLSIDGGFTPKWDRAHVCPNLAAAMLVCAHLQLNPTDYVYRVIEPENPLLAAEFCSRPEAA